jgi:hypothetical protein
LSAPVELPEVLRPAFEVGGADAVLRLSKAFGGQRIHVPKAPSDSHPLVKAGGRAAAAAIASAYGGEQVEFPFGVRAVRLIIAAVEISGGASNNGLAKVLGISNREAKRLRARLKKGISRGTLKGLKAVRTPKRDPRQLDLVDMLR